MQKSLSPETKQPLIKISYDPASKQNIHKTLYHFQSCMVLACVGDTIGFKNGKWEFNYNGRSIQQDLLVRTDYLGILALKIDAKDWRYSDDTVMHIATARGLLEANDKDAQFEIIRKIAAHYKLCVRDMGGRAPGKTTISALQKLKEDGSNWNHFQFNQRGWGCGGSMRAACIGLAYYRQNQLDRLIAVSIQTARITHHNPVGYLGSLLAAYFTSLAIRRVNPKLWMSQFQKKVISKATNYIKSCKRDVQANLGKDWCLALQCIDSYCQRRKIPYWQKLICLKDIESFFSQNFKSIEQRQKQWATYGFKVKWVGSLGVDSALLAFDALLYSKGNYQTMCNVSIVHGGDNDSTATIAGAWYGAYYGMREAPGNHYEYMEGLQVVNKLGKELFEKYCLSKQSDIPFVGDSAMIS